jgi:hypothetical protein
LHNGLGQIFVHFDNRSDFGRVVQLVGRHDGTAVCGSIAAGAESNQSQMREKNKIEARKHNTTRK